MSNKRDLVKITCYGETEIMEREKAKAFYFDCMIHSEGAEQSRYVAIYTQLSLGYTECTDEKI